MGKVALGLKPYVFQMDMHGEVLNHMDMQHLLCCSQTDGHAGRSVF